MIGENCSMGQNVNVANNVKIGNFVKIQNNVSVYEGVELEDHVFCGPSCVFTNDLTPRSKWLEPYISTLVKEGASIGANATIVCGNTIGRHAMIGAGSVVTRDVPDYALMVGVPAKRVGWICECGVILSADSPSNADHKYTCNKCKRVYIESNGELGENIKDMMV